MLEAKRINSHLTVSATKLLAFEGPAGARIFSCHIADSALPYAGAAASSKS